MSCANIDMQAQSEHIRSFPETSTYVVHEAVYECLLVSRSRQAELLAQSVENFAIVLRLQS